MSNTITLRLLGNNLIATINLNGEICGQRYRTREVALSAYMTEAAILDARGVLANDSCILD